jgi:transposase
LGIDEICVGHGYQFLTLVLDLDSGAILFVGKGKKAAALTPFWRRLRASRATDEFNAHGPSPLDWRVPLAMPVSDEVLARSQ